MKVLILLVLSLSASLAHASALELKLGPAGIGSGGTNPAGIPPTATDIDITYLTQDAWQYTFSVSPGILLGKRFTQGNFFGTIGGGLIINGNGIGAGPYSGLGYKAKFGTNGAFVAEFKQAIGFSSEHILLPYAFRIGVSYEF